jgi:gamma-glutamylaminecyclotransferase
MSVTPASQRVFVYGTLKEGFRNFGVSRGRRVPGEFVTVDRFALYVIGVHGLPWLVPVAAHEEGHAVRGQVFEVDAATLANMDRLERIDEAGWYQRATLHVRAAEGGEAFEALVYLGARERLATDAVHLGPLVEYTEAHQALYRRHL